MHYYKRKPASTTLSHTHYQSIIALWCTTLTQTNTKIMIIHFPCDLNILREKLHLP